MKYRQVTEKERYFICNALSMGVSKTSIAHSLGRHRSTIMREITRNKDRKGHYKPLISHRLAIARRKDSRRKSYFAESELNLVRGKIRIDWAPEQISLRFAETGELSIHFVTIYRQIKRDKRRGGYLFRHLRQANKKRRKGYGHPDHRGILQGKRNISERPKEAEARMEFGHAEADLIRGYKGQGWLLSLIDRKTRYLKLRTLGGSKSVKRVNRNLIRLIKLLGLKTITVDNGTEFHGYKKVEEVTGVKFYFANPHCSWERGSIENTNGLIRQYFSKSISLIHVTQARCNFVEMRINNRPRKILNMKTPKECYHELCEMSHLPG